MRRLYTRAIFARCRGLSHSVGAHAVPEAATDASDTDDDDDQDVNGRTLRLRLKNRFRHRLNAKHNTAFLHNIGRAGRK